MEKKGLEHVKKNSKVVSSHNFVPYNTATVSTSACPVVNSELRSTRKVPPRSRSQLIYDTLECLKDIATNNREDIANTFKRCGWTLKIDGAEDSMLNKNLVNDEYRNHYKNVITLPKTARERQRSAFRKVP